MNPHIVSTHWLQDHLEDPDVRIVDIRGKALVPEERSQAVLDHYQDYTQSHIPGAVFVNWVTDITDDAQHKRIAPPEQYARALSKLGLTNDHLIVIYDDAGNTLSARMWWSLHYYGHTKAAVLDGGWPKWRDEGRPTTANMPATETTDFTAHPQRNLLRQGDDILHLLGSTTRIVDMRLPDEYNGEMSLARFNGHIPGATNLPVSELLQPNGTLLPVEKLSQRLAGAGVEATAPEVIFYGNVGVVSCLGILAMRVAGLTTVASNYDASWQEWGNDERKPRE